MSINSPLPRKFVSPHLAIIWIILLSLPIWLLAVGGYYSIVTQVLILGLAAMALNYLLGFTGVLSFGHAAYFGLGAYGCGLTLKFLAASSVLGIAIGVLTGTIAAAIIGLLIVRLRGVYFAMVTIAFSQVFYFIVFRWNDVTGGDDGLGGFERQPLSLLGFSIDIQHSQMLFYYFVVVFVAIGTGAMALLLRSPIGRAQLAIRENERRARFLGLAIERHIWVAWVISCAFTSLAGALYALLNNFADPRLLYWTFSGDLVIMTVLGGMRSFWGPMLGAALFVILRDTISSHTENWMSFIGLFFVLVVLFFPRGILGMLRRRKGA